MPATRHTFSIGPMVLTILAFLCFQEALFNRPGTTLSYRDFKVLLKAGKVVDLSLGERTITGRLSTAGLERLLPQEKIDADRHSTSLCCAGAL